MGRATYGSIGTQLTSDLGFSIQVEPNPKSGPNCIKLYKAQTIHRKPNSIDQMGTFKPNIVQAAWARARYWTIFQGGPDLAMPQCGPAWPMNTLLLNQLGWKDLNHVISTFNVAVNPYPWEQLD